MRALFYTTLLSFLVLASVSCVRKEPAKTEDSPVIMEDTPARGVGGQNTNGLGGEVKRERQNVKVVNTGDIQKLKKYSAVVATLTQPKGIEALKQFFERDGIKYFVVKNPQNRYYFIISSSDSEDEVLQARASFLIANTVDKSRRDIWEKYYIQLTDIFILEKE